MDFGEWVRSERKRKHLTQAELARMAGVSQFTICYCERGEHILIKKNQQKITAALNAAQDRLRVPDYALRGGVARPEPQETKAMTNGDVIRMMTDEELVFVIHCLKCECSIPQNERDCYRCKLDYLRSTIERSVTHGCEAQKDDRAG